VFASDELKGSEYDVVHDRSLSINYAPKGDLLDTIADHLQALNRGA